MSGLPTLDIRRIGGDVAVDFLNTVDWRLAPQRRHERLTSYGHLLAWTLGTGLLSAQESAALAERAAGSPEAARTELLAALALREDVYAALTEGAQPTGLQRALRRAHSRSRLSRVEDGRWEWVQDDLALSTPADRLALEFARLLTSPEVAQFHRCEDDQCGWVFLDTSRQHNRRWCSSSDCGNRNRLRAHYRRAKAASDPS